ncbi:33 kDa chaperonin HslO [hydrothermal vent metagenome]|uniref:33 kDa chaperonin HslO n=1 Tax=hydrothermal vent metagenome TaxID=652676 RepID=A0A3B0U2M8_9ZZZZ
MNKTPANDPVSMEKYGLDRPESGDDIYVPFTLENLNCRGRSLRLANALHKIISAHDYPAPVARVLGEAIVLTALMGSSMKFAGRFILQSQTDGPVNLIVVDLDAPDGLRAYARFDKDALEAMDKNKPSNSAHLLGKGHLAMTVDQGAHTERYQGIVEIDGSGLETAAEHYFAQSEQIPTKVRLAVGSHKAKGDKNSGWRAGGMMVQYLPKAKIDANEQPELVDLPGDGIPADADNDEDNWAEAQALFATIGDDELLDPQISIERLLLRLFHEKGVTIFDPEPLVARCTCSPERSEAMLQTNFSAQERLDMAVDGEIEITCEFCSTTYHFNPNQFVIED